MKKLKVDWFLGWYLHSYCCIEVQVTRDVQGIVGREGQHGDDASE